MDGNITKDEKERIQRIADDLGEHYDGVLILVSRVADGHTAMGIGTSGNYYTRAAMAREYALHRDGEALEAGMQIERERRSE